MSNEHKCLYGGRHQFQTTSVGNICKKCGIPEKELKKVNGMIDLSDAVVNEDEEDESEDEEGAACSVFDRSEDEVVSAY